MKLATRIQIMKTFKGRIMHYTASIGNWSADGATKAEAEAKLAAFIERVASEDSTSAIRRDAKGDVWMAMRYNGGDWGYGRWFLDTRPGYEGRFLSAGCSFGSKELASRDLTINSMDRHMTSLRLGRPMDEAKMCCGFHRRGNDNAAPCSE